MLGVPVGKNPRVDGQCRRIVRHEGVRLSGVYLRPVREPGARPACEVARRSIRQLSFGFARPQPRPHGRGRVRRRGPHPRAQDRRRRQSRRLSQQRDGAAADRQHRQEQHRRLSHPGAGGDDALRVHEHDAGGAVPRRGPAGGKLLHRTPARHRGARDGHRSGRDPPHQPHPRRRDAVQDRCRNRVRQRRFSGGAGARARARRLGRLRRARRGEPRAREAARARHRPVS